MRYKYGCLLLIFGALVLLSTCAKEKENANGKLKSTGPSAISLQLQSPEKTGIDFNNTISDMPNLNIFIWNFFYTGSGVAVGDLNNDGLPDLYFGGNVVSDKIYINKGNFEFEDITAQSGINPRAWTTGITMADVNSDGFLDIYVCKNSPTAIPKNNLNRLYINNKNGTFTDQTVAFGLDDTGLSVQASFFDADNDGDLDMYLINQPFDAFAARVNKPEDIAGFPSSDRMFFFENGKFVDKTATLQLENERYGLNISLGDFDLNGWTDFYVSNDYHHADHLYFNQKGIFQDEVHKRMGHISFYSMGTDAADVNNDGLLDLMSLDMAFADHNRSKTNMQSMDSDRFWELVADKQHYQYAQNDLQINTGNGGFKEIAQLTGMAKTDWSWAPLFVDLDNDGNQDALVTNGVLRDMQNNDFDEFVLQNFGGYVGPQNIGEVIPRLPSNPISNIAYQNKGDYKFEDISQSSGFNFKGFSQGMAYADFDQDGHMDVVVNNMNAPAGIYKNVSTNSGNYLSINLKGTPKNLQGLGLSVVVYTGEEKQIGCMQSTRGYLSSSEPILHFGIGDNSKVDSVKVIWNHQQMSVIQEVPTNQKMIIDYAKVNKVPFKNSLRKGIVLDESNAINYNHKEIPFDDYEAQVLLPYKLSQNGPFMALGDINKDGLDDLFIGGAAGQAGQIFQQNKEGGYTQTTQTALKKDAAYEDMEAAFFDVDGDQDQDLYLVSGSNEFSEKDVLLADRLYLNDGSGQFTKASNILPGSNLINGQSILPFDADGDGDQDLFVGGRLVAGQYPVAADSKLWINEKGKFLDQSEKNADFLKEFGMVTDAVADDVDADGDQDIVVVGEWMTPQILRNDGKGVFTPEIITQAGSGLWWSIQKADFDQDGDVDLLLGNLGWNHKFGGSKPAQLEIYSNDFDQNGDYDVVLATNKNNKTLPVRGRECSSQEMPFILQKFPSYQAFADADINDILSESQRNNSIHKEIKNFSSIYLENDGTGQFNSKTLPAECQFGPIKGFDICDLNEDGNPDFVFGGNHFPAEVETARYDGLGFGFCLGDGKGQFTYVSHQLSKPMGPLDVRDVKVITSATGKKQVVIATNDGPVKVLNFNQ